MLEASGWKGLAGTAIVSDPAVKNFVQSAVGALAAEGQARIDRLFLNGTAVAATVTLASGDTAWCWKIAYNEGLARSSPGVQLVCDLTESLLAEPGPARVNSCAAAGHPMIDHVWRERLALSDRLIALRPSWLPFALACRIETLRRRAIAAAKAVRDRLRQPLKFLLSSNCRQRAQAIDPSNQRQERRWPATPRKPKPTLLPKRPTPAPKKKRPTRVAKKEAAQADKSTSDARCRSPKPRAATQPRRRPRTTAGARARSP